MFFPNRLIKVSRAPRGKVSAPRKEEKMTAIYIYKNNQQLGPFADTAVLGWLGSGQLSGEDFACPVGGHGWQPLKNLFPAMTPSAQIPATSVSPAGGGAFVPNRAAAEWARRNLFNPVEIKLRYHSAAARMTVGIGYAILAVGLLWLPCAILISAVYRLVTGGWSDAVSGGLVFGMILLVVLGGLLAAIVFLVTATRRKMALFLSAEGVETRGRQKYAWENLRCLEYKKASTRVRGNLIASATQAALMAGVQKVTVELIFTDGKAVVPPLIANQPEILALLAGLPAARR
jgi:hypothetical protein